MGADENSIKTKRNVKRPKEIFDNKYEYSNTENNENNFKNVEHYQFQVN